MRTLLFILLCFWQCSAQATSYFVKDKNCEAISDKVTIKTQMSFFQSDSEVEAQQDLRTEALFEYKKIKNSLTANSQIYVKERFVMNTTQESTSSNSAKKRLFYTAHFTLSKNCNENQAMSEATFIAGKHIFRMLKSKEKKITFFLNSNDQPVFKEFDSKLITSNHFFDTKFGQSTQEVTQQLGLHSLELKNENKIIHVYGRHHAFHFVNNQLVGYQFHLNLLPMQINNMLTLENKELKIKLSNDEIVDAATPIAPLQITALKKEFADVETAYYKSSDTEVDQRLIGLSQGQLIGKIAFNKHCIKSFIAKTDGNLDKNINTSLKLTSSSEDNISVTPCGEFLYKKADFITELKLFEPISTNNIKLSALANYFKQGHGWEFSGVKYNDPVASLTKLGDYNEFFDSAEFTSQYWDGYFYIYDGKLIGAELTSNDY